MRNWLIVVHTILWPTNSYHMLIRKSNGFLALVGWRKSWNLVAQHSAISFSSSRAMVGSEDITLKLTKTQVSANFVIPPLKTQNTSGPLVGNSTGSDMLYAKMLKRITALYLFLNPLCGQSRKFSGSFVIKNGGVVGRPRDTTKFVRNYYGLHCHM